MERLGVDVRSGIDEDTDIFFSRKIGGDPGTLDSLKGAELDRGRRDGCTRMACTDNGVGLPLLDEVDGAGDGGILFLADCLDGGVAHLHDLSGVDDLDARIGAAMLGEFGPDGLFVACQENLGDLRVLPERHHGTCHGIGGSVIPTHGVKGDPHDP